MLVSYKWLKEYVDIPISPQELADRLTLVGVAVEKVHNLSEGIEDVYIGKILKIEQHPNADKLVICTVTTGGEPVRIVTGATNVREGHVIPVAVVGAKLPGGVKIKKAKLRGVESRGMLCSGQELGIDTKLLPPDQQHGILILPEDAPLGADAREFLGLNDMLLELDLTPNRGDCLSMIGVAREVAAILGQKMRVPEPRIKELSESIDGRARVDISATTLCRRYVARVLTNVKVGPSPVWMQQRLRAAGIRPISNIVDVTNYVMLEMGQPLHAFDYDSLKNHHIIVRRAAAGEKMVTLDGSERELEKDMLVITDPGGPVAVAGVMGGLHTEITEKTTTVLLESAYFHPISVRRTSKKLGLRSESSLRFEKGIDLAGCLCAANRACQLMQEMGAADVLAGAIDNYPEPLVEKTVALRPARVNHLLGVEVPREQIISILSSLEFKVQENGEEILATVPTHRNDVGIEADLIEEVARMYGFNQIPNTRIYGANTRGAKTPVQMKETQIKDVLTACGLTEVITYSFINPRVFDALRLPGDSPFRNVVKIKNPLSEDHSVMRTVLLSNLLEVLQRNYSRRVQNGAIFEMGRIFLPTNERLPEEIPVLGAAVMGKLPQAWNKPAVEMDFYYLKGVLESLFDTIGLDKVVFIPEESGHSYHPGRTAAVHLAGKQIGIIGEVHPDVLENYNLPERVIACEINLTEVFAAGGKVKKYQSLPRFPGVDRDLAVVISREVPVQELFKVIRAAGGKLLRLVKLFDVYSGKQVPEGYQSLAFALNLQADDHTLTDTEINETVENIKSALAKELGAELRG
ncbi:phenylalanine--tRNA ligase subunit beta [Desulfolucanica intricata]|uniref:phenylalanine--tRNA ligase subunit beta n=1 Tax=Desulfolucanica intricata TaxID=1285191 RepID=UPI00082C8CFA|nr:phenylalanine--tRNA ligase subunit beta [Desulfolucanica intricata]